MALNHLTDEQLRDEWLAFKEEAFEAAQVDGEPGVYVVKRLELLKAEMERRGLKL